MTALRVFHPVTAPTDLDGRLVAHTTALRGTAGCLEAEVYRPTSRSGEALIVELWESEAALADAWRSVLAGPDPWLRRLLERDEAAPSEFYAHRTFHKERGWVDDSLPRDTVIEWPSRDAVRVAILTSTAEPEEALAGFAADEEATRREFGCLGYDWCRSLEDPHHFVLAELWQSQAIYDAHWGLRLKVADAGVARGEPAPARPPYPRTLGVNGAEFYRHQPFRHHYDRWRPAAPGSLSETVAWGQ